MAMPVLIGDVDRTQAADRAMTGPASATAREAMMIFFMVSDLQVAGSRTLKARNWSRRADQLSSAPLWNSKRAVSNG
ncbi:hypothetical protein [Rhizobium sp. BK456]|uniref:hypothetical protein n=1 Tax=Rhizobium sp. BK456 TaxID=2587007 RepID=UPI00161F3020|nr:hypothetical protein [Rhizobium sp. BK456]MBB3527246.1 hypothetical protein [Rhizobium sp. BK456]